MLHDLIEEKVESKDGMIAIPDRPGLGITVREDVVAKHAVQSTMSEHRDLVSELALFFLQRKYEPGERVPSERELAERFKAGRGLVREALAYLEALRVIDRRAKSGIYMSSDSASVEALALFAQIGVPLQADEVRQSNEMRRIHEITAVQARLRARDARKFRPHAGRARFLAQAHRGTASRSTSRTATSISRSSTPRRTMCSIASCASSI